MTPLEISQQEFDLIRGFIERECSIALGKDKQYLIESRLAKLVVENGCSSFSEFYRKLTGTADKGLRDRVVDAMTTNETLWFRDNAPWRALRDQILPDLASQIGSDPARKAKIWSAACSTGQEPYTIAMVIDDFCRSHIGPKVEPSRFEIVGTDISPSALFIAMAGRYDRISMNRGLTDDWASFKDRYFTKKGTISQISPDIKGRVKFKRFNLQDDFAALGSFDVVFLRNVAIYFSDEFKTSLFRRIKRSMNKRGYFFLGASETLTGYSVGFETERQGRATYYRNVE